MIHPLPAITSSAHIQTPCAHPDEAGSNPYHHSLVSNSIFDFVGEGAVAA
jgi:hypothetical protein